MEINLGVIEQAYKDGTTVPEVARYLEDEYGVMQVFVDLHMKDISNSVAQAVADAMDDELMGLPVSPDIYQGAMEEIQSAFRNFLDNEEYPAQSDPQVPTQAALDGVNHRLLHPYASKNPPRPSFIDTGEYQVSFRAWVAQQ
ncbi:hypothetical protein KTF23_11895 [Burkholderia multivorans]|uniref:hypothetical protein n=1 Tax=Burkholderia multivorans TaxID=87883 RepID=UPI001C2453BE|nr:hypothetical protein [Burkholderia multivorans]MBU9690543.1 hypothetical protein [Burkholderia multivorans]